MCIKRYEIFATCYDKKGKAISFGKNDYTRSHPLFKHFAILAGESEEKIYKHAEFAAIIAAGKKEVHSITVERFDKKGQPALAKPCKTCTLVLKSFGVKIVNYTEKGGVVSKNIGELYNEFNWKNCRKVNC